MKKLLLIALLIVGCDNSTESNNNSIIGKWIITESTNAMMSENYDGCNNFLVDTYFDITIDNFILISEVVGLDENGNHTTNWFWAMEFNYVNDNPNLTLSYNSSDHEFGIEDLQVEKYFTYEINGTELHLQSLSRILNGDTTTCNSNIIATSVSAVPDNCHLLDNSCEARPPEDCAGVAGGTAVLSGCDNACNSTVVVDCADVCGGGNICGCTDATAANFNSLATYDDGSCAYSADFTLTQQQVISSNNSFGIKLFKELNQTDPISSVFVSPLSISMALGMTLNGADNETYEAMIEVLEKADLSEVEINEAYQSLIALLTQLDEDVILNIANSIWYKDTFTVEQTFLDVNQTYFDAVVEALDFTNVSLVVNTINGWVNENTNELIPTIINENHVTSETIMFLVNAIYYKGTWTTEFDPELTEDKPFYNYDNITSTVPLMHMEGTLSASVTETFVAVDLPYGDELFSMTVILPNIGVDINEFAAELNNENWDQWISDFHMFEVVQLYLPRFTLEWKSSLKDILSTMGMEIAFSDQADFSRINSGVSLKITDVIHKTFVEVNEEGTEAAAVTVVGIHEISAQPTPPVIRVDRPFIFAIREKFSGTILFIGKVLNL